MIGRLALAALVPMLVAPAGWAVGRHDVAVVAVRTGRWLSLTDRRPTRTRRLVVRLQNRGVRPVVVPDAAALAAGLAIGVTPGPGPIACAPPTIAPARATFPLTIEPARTRSLRFDVTLACAPSPGAGLAWSFSAVVDLRRLAGNADEDPPDDVCPRPPLGQLRGPRGPIDDRGCREARVSIRDRRASTRWQVPGAFAVGTADLRLVDASRPTMPNGDWPGAPERTLRTLVWYPATAPGADAPLAVASGPHPLVVFSHGLGSIAAQSTFLCAHLASHGYVVVAPAYPLAQAGAPGGQTMADKPAEVGDVSYLIDTFTAWAASPGHRFAGAVDPARTVLTGHSNGGLLTMVAAYDRRLRDPRIRAAAPLAPAACVLQDGYFGDVAVPLLMLQGSSDLFLDPTAFAEAVWERANAPRSFVGIAGGNHLGFTDLGAGVGDADACNLLPDIATLAASLVRLVAALGGPEAHVGFDGCIAPRCTSGDPTPHLPGLRQAQITKQVVLAFFEWVLHQDRAAERFLSVELAAANPDVRHRFER